MLSSMLGALALVAQASPEPLRPTAKWVVNYAPDSCELQRNYGTAEVPLILGIRRWPMTSYAEIALILPGNNLGSANEGQLKVVIGDGDPVERNYRSWAMKQQPGRVVDILLPVKQLDALKNADRVSFQWKDGKRLDFALLASAKALAAVDTCETDLLKRWNIDPALSEKIGQPAEPIQSPTEWFFYGEYPPIAKQNGIEGRVAVFIEIDTGGRVSSCRPLGPPHGADLDQGTCATLIKNARFRPARDKNGNAIGSNQIINVRWQLQENP